jgi:hypothetical protein
MKERRNRRALFAGSIVATSLAVAVLAASPAAYAQGEFSENQTPWGCTELTWSGKSYKPSSSTIAAWTKKTEPVCIPNSGIQVMAKVYTAGVSGPTQWTDGNSISSVAATDSARGQHKLSQYRHQTMEWSRNT